MNEQPARPHLHIVRDGEYAHPPRVDELGEPVLHVLDAPVRTLPSRAARRCKRGAIRTAYAAVHSYRELHPIAPLLDKLTSALNKVYQRKGVNINLDISPEISFVGEQNDFVEVLGNVLDNACKYCLEFVEISAQLSEDQLHILVEDDGPGIPQSKREVVFDRGQRVDTLRPGQGVGLAVAREITEQYDGQIIAGDSLLGGARMEVIFGRQQPGQIDE